MSVRRANAHTLQILDPQAFVLPYKCVVCLEAEITWVTYHQYNAPVITPIVGVARFVANVSLPYCKRHAARLRNRLFWLRASQILTISLVFGGGFVATRVGMSDKYLWVLPAIGVPALLWLVVSLYAIRPRIYDASYSFTSEYTYLHSKAAAFLDAVMEENCRT
jgi:hypothetical protein